MSVFQHPPHADVLRDGRGRSADLLAYRHLGHLVVLEPSGSFPHASRPPTRWWQGRYLLAGCSRWLRLWRLTGWCPQLCWYLRLYRRNLVRHLLVVTEGDPPDRRVSQQYARCPSWYCLVGTPRRCVGLRPQCRSVRGPGLASWRRARLYCRLRSPTRRSECHGFGRDGRAPVMMTRCRPGSS